MEKKKKIVPYESAEEFLAAQKEHGMYIRFRDWKGLPIIVDDDGIQVIDPIPYDRLIHYSFLDGHVCGKEVEVLTGKGGNNGLLR